MNDHLQLQNIYLIYPNLTTIDNNFITVNVINDIYVSFNINFDLYDSYDLKGNNYNEKIKEILEVVRLENTTIDIVLVLQYFVNQFKHQLVAGFDLNNNCEKMEEYNGKTDLFWNLIRQKYNINNKRKLHIITYGEKFMHEIKLKINICEAQCNATILRRNQSKQNIKIIHKLRGTNFLIQDEIRKTEYFFQIY